jgi:Nif-specific regulatory protein
MLAVNCAAIPAELMESQLFGHKAGSFTGADRDHAGLFQQADLGTLFLDEVGELTLQGQSKLLRILEGHPFLPVGATREIQVDVRVIAATNRDLEKAVAEKTFRPDLYFRLRVVEVYVPPLRKRPEDILELANYFLDRYNSETGRRVRGFTPEAKHRMQQYRWPGNVRELKNVIERAVVLARTEFIEPEDLNLSNLATASESGENLFAAQPKSSFEPLSLDEIERRHILATLNATGWNTSRAALILGVERSTLDRKIRRYEMQPPPGKGAEWQAAE